jgi:hypothetical protein
MRHVITAIVGFALTAFVPDTCCAGPFRHCARRCCMDTACCTMPLLICPTCNSGINTTSTRRTCKDTWRAFASPTIPDGCVVTGYFYDPYPTRYMWVTYIKDCPSGTELSCCCINPADITVAPNGWSVIKNWHCDACGSFPYLNVTTIRRN